MAKLAVTLVKSPIGYRPAARATVAAIGLRRLHQTVIVDDNQSLRGMLNRVTYLLKVEPADEQPTPSAWRMGGVEISRPSEVVKSTTQMEAPTAAPSRERKRRVKTSADVAAQPNEEASGGAIRADESVADVDIEGAAVDPGSEGTQQ